MSNVEDKCSSIYSKNGEHDWLKKESVLKTLGDPLIDKWQECRNCKVEKEYEEE